MRWTAALALLLLAGCAVPDPEGGPSATPDNPEPDEAAPDEPRFCPPDCFQGHEVRLLVGVNATGAYRLDVPLPHGSWCLPPSDFLAGEREAVNLTATLREADGGRTGTVLRLEGHGVGHWEGAVDVADRAECQTLRYDPWSTDPDPEAEGVDVRADAPLRASLSVSDHEGPCWTVTTYVGDAGGSWSFLPSTGTGTACA